MENTRLKAKDIKDNYSLSDFLHRLGYGPPKRVHNELLYLSPIRGSDTTPSFSVNDKQGTWYDFGEGKGGNIIDLGLLLWPGTPFNEVLEHIVSHHGALNGTYKRQLEIEKEPNYEILEIKDLGGNAAINSYLETRGIAQVAQGRLKEIYYYVVDEAKKRSNFFAAGWQNEQGAWEIRNLNFKGCLGHKAISFIPNSEKRIAIFEGFFDYLSWLTENKFAPDSVLVLNSLSLLQACIEKARNFREVNLYFDNDTSGRNATAQFTTEIPWAADRSAIYANYNDYNDLIVAEQHQYELNR